MSATSRTIATIDGKAVDVRRGETILDAAARAGIEIPTLCHAPGIAPEGGCRMCLVEIEGQRPQAACHTPIAPGMTVRTASPLLTRVRRDLLALTLSATPAGAFTANPGGSKFEQLLAVYGVESSDFGRHAEHGQPDESHPYMRFDRDKCITCRLCLNACEQVQGQFVFGIEGRAGRTRLIFGPTERFADSDCVACGACVDRCPTGAISDRDRTATAGELHADFAADSVCGYCGVGCRGHVEAKRGVVLRIRGVTDATVNHGHLCVKGRYAHGYHHAPDRLTTPMIRDGPGAPPTLRPATWDEAIAFTARRLAEIRDRRTGGGPNALGTMTSSRSTNEAAYLLQKLFRSIIGTNNTDCCARVCHSSTAVALGAVTGTGAATASYADLDVATLIVVAGANPTEAHPVVGARIKQAALRGVPLVVIDPRAIELSRYAAVHLQLWPGTNVPMFNALAKVIVEERLHDARYVHDRCEGFDELCRFLADQSLDELASLTRVPVELIRRAARIIAGGGEGRGGGGLFISGLGLSEQTQGVAGVMAYCNLGLLTGSLGKRGSGMLPLRGQNNVQGNADMGSQPYSLTGYMKLGDPTVQARLHRIWGQAPPIEPGKTIPEMYDAAIAGTLKALWIQGEDVVQSDPNRDHVIKALGSLELLIVQELFMTETAELAHVVLPAAAVLEQEGTFTNGERRVQHVRPAVAPPVGARPDWEVIRDVGIAMGGLGATWRYEHPSQIMDEIAAVVPDLFGGVSYDRLATDGVQWPCPTRDHPGTRTVHEGGFVRGKGAFMCVEYLPPLDAADAAHPMVLITGRILDHYNVGTMTRRTPSGRIVSADHLELHPEDAARLGVSDGARVRVRSRWGQTVAPAKVSRRVLPGTSFLSFHFPETRTNRVVGPHVDRTSKCPDYKVVAVALSPA
jgi:formate dehydrogenase alpha subunit